MILQPDYPDNWKIDALVRLTGTESAVRCHLRLLAHCQKSQRWRFDLKPFQLASICKWEGEATEWFKALEQCILIDVFADDTWGVHDWPEHNAKMSANWGKNPSGKARPNRSPSEGQRHPNATPSEPQNRKNATPTKPQSPTPTTPSEVQGGELPEPNAPRLEGRMDGRLGKEGRMDGGVLPPGGKKRFIPPSLEEWRAEAARAGWQGARDVDAAFHSYTAKGWKVGRTPMVDWKAAVRTCLERWRGENPGGQKNNPPPNTPGDAAAFAAAPAHFPTED